MEPEFDEVIDRTFVSPSNLTVNGPIYLAKEDNVQSEQNFRIIVQVADSVPSGENINPAKIGTDYSIGHGTTAVIVVDFHPRMQKVNLPFTLFSDTYPEGTEAFRLNASAADVGGDLPGYLPPIALFAETFVIVQDDDRKGLCEISLLL